MSRKKKKKVEPVSADRLVNISKLLRQTADAHAVLNRSPTIRPPLADKEIVSRMLAFANERSTVEEIASAMSTTELSHGHSRLDSDFKEPIDDPEFRKYVLDYWDKTRNGREWFRNVLLQITLNPKKAARNLEPELQEQLNNIVIIPSLSWRNTKLIREDYFYSLSLDGTVAYVLMLLLDPTRNLSDALRRCRLPECGRFFLAESSGGRRPVYCGDDCRAISKKLASAESSRKSRRKISKNKKGKR